MPFPTKPGPTFKTPRFSPISKRRSKMHSTTSTTSVRCAIIHNGTIFGRDRGHTMSAPKGRKQIDAILAATEDGEKRNIRRKGKLKSFQEVIAYWLSDGGLLRCPRC